MNLAIHLNIHIMNVFLEICLHSTLRCYELRVSANTSTDSTKVLGIFFNSKLCSRNYVDFLFSECVKLLGFIHSTTFRFSSLDCLCMLYFTLVRSKMEYVSVFWSYITYSDAIKLERIQQKFASFCFYRFFPSCSIY
jgi:hypothetical protein